MGRIVREVRNQSCMLTVSGSSWNIANFEEVADEVDSRDEELMNMHAYTLQTGSYTL